MALRCQSKRLNQVIDEWLQLAPFAVEVGNERRLFCYWSMIGPRRFASTLSCHGFFPDHACALALLFLKRSFKLCATLDHSIAYLRCAPLGICVQLCRGLLFSYGDGAM